MLVAARKPVCSSLDQSQSSFFPAARGLAAPKARAIEVTPPAPAPGHTSRQPLAAWHPNPAAHRGGDIRSARRWRRLELLLDEGEGQNAFVRDGAEELREGERLVAHLARLRDVGEEAVERQLANDVARAVAGLTQLEQLLVGHQVAPRL